MTADGNFITTEGGATLQSRCQTSKSHCLPLSVSRNGHEVRLIRSTVGDQLGSYSSMVKVSMALAHSLRVVYPAERTIQ